MTSHLKNDLESVYGSSIYGGGGQFTDDSDLPEYAQLCRRLFPTLLSATLDYNDDGSEEEDIEPEAEETIARYFKYLTGLPLPSLKMEPALLQGDLQRVSDELTALLFKESFSNSSSGGSLDPFESNLSQKQQQQVDIGDKPLFGVVDDMNKLAVSTTSKLSAQLAKTQETLGRLETACGLFSVEIADLDQRAKVVHQVLDKQDLITRIVELPRVMQMCVAGGFYEEAVEMAEHVKVTGDRLVRDISEDMQLVPRQSRASRVVRTQGAPDQLAGFVRMIQKQVQAEYEAMVLGLCRELSYTRWATTVSPQQQQQQQGGMSGKMDGGYERSMRRMSQMTKIMSILRSVGMFSESELRMLYLRSRWQAWGTTADSLSGFAPQESAGASGLEAFGLEAFGLGTPAISSHVVSSPAIGSPAAQPQRGSERATGASSAEVAAYLTKYIDAFFQWLAEVDQQYQTLFPEKKLAPLGSTGLTGSTGPTSGGSDPFADLTLFSSRQFLAAVMPLVPLLTDASGIAALESLLSMHARALARAKIDFAMPFLAHSLRERAFISVVGTVEGTVAGICQTILALDVSAAGGGGSESESGWDQLAAPTRPSLDVGPEFGAGLVAAAEAAENPVEFLGRLRVSPVGLLQYPVLAQLLHAFRDSLHALRILVLASDGSGGVEGEGEGEVLVLLNMVSVVFESELIRVAEALRSLGERIRIAAANSRAEVRESVQAVFVDACLAFTFGLARHVAEVFEEVATLNESAHLDSSSLSGGLAAGDLTTVLYSADIYTPLLEHIAANPV
ncbi:hypothetical protein BX661DRAFT_175563 [Kickxella alabastrina]|uniref:uncharacterized protein n=1 Tax=Kickxella alabastrina TaxID=61397 RepID=UPI00221F744B|nr:uncharacterized protein BX661DRAFT_175563 [Kickxella alabastrina]KAI7834810.1 hypothetical protein BX661DRAFT_175563 [Kickxella alabastrina]KAJ1946403.1 hypothetical protein GGF37_001184 [Kickxella alabastrina]